MKVKQSAGKFVKRILHTLIFLVLIANISCNNDTIMIFVSPGGDNNNPGTKRSPLANIEGATVALKLMKEKPENNDKEFVVYFREGEYFFNKTHTLYSEHSGSPDAPILFSAYESENVIFSGGVKLSSSDFKKVKEESVLKRIIDKSARDHVLEVDLRALGINDYGRIKQHGFSIAIKPAPMELFINGEPMTLAKYPNEGRLPVTSVIKDCTRAIDGDFSNQPGIISYDFGRPDYWTKAEDIWLWGYFLAGFADDNLGVSSVDSLHNTISLKNAHMFGMIPTDTTDEWGGRIVGYYAYNLLEEIDTPGEYYIDRSTGILYLYPPQGFETANIRLSNIEDPLLAIENTSNIIFSGITFELSKGMGVYFENSENIKFNHCIFRNLGTVAAMFGKGVSGADFPIHEFTGFLKPRTIGNLKAHVYENTGFSNDAGKKCGLKGCSIYNTGTGGVILSGGDRKTLVAGQNYIIDTELHDFNRWNKTYCAGITLYGVGNIIKNCYIHDAPHQGIAIFGNEHLIELNHLERLVMDVHDNGAIYIGRNPSERGNIIRHNYFAEMGQEGFKNCAIHLDDFASASLVEGNVFYKASKFDFGDILINGGSDNIIRNNVFIEGSHVLWIEDPKQAIPKDIFDSRYGLNGLMGKRMYKDININTKPWKEKYPDFKPFHDDNTPVILEGNQFYRNMIINSEFIISKHHIDQSVFVKYEDNYFANEQDLSGELAPANVLKMEAIDLSRYIQGFEAIPFSKVGTRK